MTIRPVRYLGDPALRRPAKMVETIDDSVRMLIEDMIESMCHAEGVGLAAPQIGVAMRIVVIGMPGEEPFALVNPNIVERSGSRRIEGEGCLSVPGYRAPITRSKRVTVEALNERGEPVRMTAEQNLLAQALEHEVDHVNGTLYVDRLDSIDDLQKLDGGWAGDPGEEDDGGADEGASEDDGVHTERGA